MKKSQNRRNECFSYFFCLKVEGYEAGTGIGAGSVPRTNGSGSGRPKNIGILQIWIQIPNTCLKVPEVGNDK
jgi:hypothetical protein